MLQRRKTDAAVVAYKTTFAYVTKLQTFERIVASYSGRIRIIKSNCLKHGGNLTLEAIQLNGFLPRARHLFQ